MGIDTPEDLQALMDEVDSNGNGAIDYTEFLAATLECEHYLNKSNCLRAFQTFDLDGDGRIIRQELISLLCGNPELADSNVGMDVAALDAVLADVKLDDDGCLSLDEFMVMLKR